MHILELHDTLFSLQSSHAFVALALPNRAEEMIVRKTLEGPRAVVTSRLLIDRWVPIRVVHDGSRLVQAAAAGRWVATKNETLLIPARLISSTSSNILSSSDESSGPPLYTVLQV